MNLIKLIDMEKYSFKFVNACLAIFVILSGCGGGSGSSGQGKIKMVTETRYISFIVGGIGDVTVDWGDGSKNELMIGKSFVTFEHNYKKASKHTITISGDELRVLECYDNQLTSLDVSNCPLLKGLDCKNNQLTSLDVNNCPLLAVLKCNKNQLTGLDVSNCSALYLLDCSNNQLTNLDVSDFSALTKLNCRNNQLASLGVINCPQLSELDCRENFLANLDVSDCSALIDVDCSNNQLTAASLDALFGTLHENVIILKSKFLNISSNIGERDCNRIIAQNKKWYVSNKK